MPRDRQDGYPVSGIRFTAAISDIHIIYPRDEGSLQGKLQQALQAKSLSAVRLSTVYKAKGLQSKVVIFAGAEQLPSQSLERDEQAERAAFYVALTRPEDLLIVLYTHDTRYIGELLRNIARFRGEEHV